MLRHPDPPSPRVEVGGPGIAAEGLVVVGDGVLESPLVGLDVRPGCVRGRLVRVQPDRPIEVGQGVIRQPARRAAGPAPVGLDVVRIACNGPVEIIRGAIEREHLIDAGPSASMPIGPGNQHISGLDPFDPQTDAGGAPRRGGCHGRRSNSRLGALRTTSVPTAIPRSARGRIAAAPHPPDRGRPARGPAAGPGRLPTPDARRSGRVERAVACPGPPASPDEEGIAGHRGAPLAGTFGEATAVCSSHSRRRDETLQSVRVNRPRGPDSGGRAARRRRAAR